MQRRRPWNKLHTSDYLEGWKIRRVDDLEGLVLPRLGDRVEPGIFPSYEQTGIPTISPASCQQHRLVFAECEHAVPCMSFGGEGV